MNLMQTLLNLKLLPPVPVMIILMVMKTLQIFTAA
jgi:hypothetical protein